MCYAEATQGALHRSWHVMSLVLGARPSRLPRSLTRTCPAARLCGGSRGGEHPAGCPEDCCDLAHRSRDLPAGLSRVLVVREQFLNAVLGCPCKRMGDVEVVGERTGRDEDAPCLCGCTDLLLLGAGEPGKGLTRLMHRCLADGRDAEAGAVMAQAAEHSPYLRWAAGNTKWTFGTPSAAEGLRKLQAYTMDGVAGQITCPTLVLDAENDQFFRGEPQRIFAALRCTKELIAFSAAEGAAEHCQSGAVLLFEQRVFDRLDALLSP